MVGMNTSKLIEAIDEEISRLQQVRRLLSEGSSDAGATVGAKAARKLPAAKKRTMSPEARARISAAQKKRWAAQKKTAGKKKTES
jgi:hypothetical protein